MFPAVPRVGGSAAVKVLHIITGLNVGGAENMLAKLLESAAQTGEQSQVVSLLEPGPLADRIEAQGIAIHTLGLRRGLATPSAALALRRLVRRLAPQVIHGWMYHGNLAASFARKCSDRPQALIWNVRHSLSDPQFETRRTRALLWLSARLSDRPDAIIYNSHAAMEEHQAIGFSPRRAVVLPNGFDCGKYRPDKAARALLESQFAIAPDALVVGCVARLHPMKDQANLVEAVARARATGYDIHLLMVGEGLAEPPTDLAALIARRLPSDRVTTSGARFDIASWMPGLDALAVPSAWGEGFPNVIGEALACGVPVVTTDVGDSARIVGAEGAVVPPSDPAGFASALERLLSLPGAARRDLGLAGRERVERDYSLSTISNRYADLYRSLATH